MLDLRSARDRAMRRAIETGHMPNMDIIHARQKMEGFEPCFGRTEAVCHRSSCRWHGDCAELARFRPVRGLGMRDVLRPILASSLNVRLEPVTDSRATPAMTETRSIPPQLEVAGSAPATAL